MIAAAMTTIETAVVAVMMTVIAIALKLFAPNAVLTSPWIWTLWKTVLPSFALNVKPNWTLNW